MEINKVYLGDCLDVMGEMDSNSVDLICTDPPYGYSFLGKKWDIDVPSVAIWKEALRVLKPGGFAFIMSAPRQDVLNKMYTNIGDAGFYTSFSSIYWTYTSGMPKGIKVDSSIDELLGETKNRLKIGVKKSVTGFGEKVVMRDVTLPSSKMAKQYHDSYPGFQPKPAVEVIIVAMKPL